MYINFKSTVKKMNKVILIISVVLLLSLVTASQGYDNPKFPKLQAPTKAVSDNVTNVFQNVTNIFQNISINNTIYQNTSEVDPHWNANSSNVARIGNCPAGFAVQNTTFSGVECVAIGGGSGNISGGGLNGQIAYFNETNTIYGNNNFTINNSAGRISGFKFSAIDSFESFGKNSVRFNQNLFTLNYNIKSSSISGTNLNAGYEYCTTIPLKTGWNFFTPVIALSTNYTNITIPITGNDENLLGYSSFISYPISKIRYNYNGGSCLYNESDCHGNLINITIVNDQENTLDRSSLNRLSSYDAYFVFPVNSGNITFENIPTQPRLTQTRIIRDLLIQDTLTGQLYNFSRATNLGLIEGQIYQYEPGVGDYSILSTSNRMTSWRGYVLRSNRDNLNFVINDTSCQGRTYTGDIVSQMGIYTNNIYYINGTPYNFGTGSGTGDGSYNETYAQFAYNQTAAAINYVNNQQFIKNNTNGGYIGLFQSITSIGNITAAWFKGLFDISSNQAHLIGFNGSTILVNSSAFCLQNGSGCPPSSGNGSVTIINLDTNPQIKSLRSPQSYALTNGWVDLFQYNVTQDTTYTLNCELLYSADAATTGMVVNVSSNASTSNVNIMYDTWSSATAKLGDSDNKLGTTLIGTGSGGAIIKPNLIIADFKAMSSGYLNLAFRSEVNLSTVNALRGSQCALYNVTALRSEPILNSTVNLPAIKSQSGDVTTINETIWRDTNFTFNYSSGKSYTLDCDILYNGSVATNGQDINVSSTGNTANVIVMYDTWSSATAKVGLSDTTFGTSLSGTGSGAGLIKPNKIIADFDSLSEGNVTLQIRSEVGNAATSFMTGSMCQFYEVTA